MVKSNIPLAQFKRLEVLNWLSPGQLQLLTGRMTELRAGKGEVLYRPGQAAQHIFLMLEGAVGLSLPSSNGKFLRLALLTPGDFFGISAFVSGWRRVSRAMALRESRVGMIDAKILVSEICGLPWESFTSLAEATIKPLLVISLRRALFLVEELTDRVALALWELSGHPNAVREKGLLTLAVTHEEIAALVGASRPRVSLALKRLENRGFFTREGSRIRAQTKPLRDYLERKYDHLL
jgi:CRP-like cAMP-binding protein